MKQFANFFSEKTGVFLLKLLQVLQKKLSVTLVFEKNAKCLPKIGKNRRKL
jgi:hypothetical protein